MKVEDFSDDELQLMRLGFKTPHQLALYFEGSKEEKRYYILNVTVAPVIFVRSQEIGDLISIVIRDGYQEASRKLGVSVSFLKSYLKESLKSNVNVEVNFKFLDKVSESELIEYAERIPYITLLKPVTGRTRGEIRLGRYFLCR